MSFSSEAKEELTRQFSEARHCQIAELSAIVNMCGKASVSEEGNYSLQIQTENESVARKCFTLLEKAFNIEAEITVKKSRYLKKSNVYIVTAKSDKPLLGNTIVQKDCCKRAFLRGAFLGTGSISAPSKAYHLELVCTVQEKATKLQEIIKSLGLDAKIVARKKYFVVYIKEGEQIALALALMGANVALMDLENVRILKEVRNNVNRKVNCETANINKTVSAAVKQIEDIRYIEETMGFSDLAPGLQEIATMRLDYPDATLKELGEMLTPSVGKSGVNHRLRKLQNIADDMRAH